MSLRYKALQPNGKPFTLVSEVKMGNVVRSTGCHSCLKLEKNYTVKKDSDGLYIMCEFGYHNISEEVDNDDNQAYSFFVSVYKV